MAAAAAARGPGLLALTTGEQANQLDAFGAVAVDSARITRRARRELARRARAAAAARAREPVPPASRELTERLAEIHARAVRQPAADPWAWLKLGPQGDMLARQAGYAAAGRCAAPERRSAPKPDPDALPGAVAALAAALAAAVEQGATTPAAIAAGLDVDALTRLEHAGTRSGSQISAAGPGMRDAERAAAIDGGPLTLSVLTRVELPEGANALDVRELRAAVRNALRGLYPRNSNLRKCGERRYAGAVDVMTRETVDPVSSRRSRRSALVGIVRCGSVSACVKCAPRISAARAEIVGALGAAHRATGGGIYMLTPTIPHTAEQRLKPNRRRVGLAWQKMQTGQPWKRLKRELGFVGSISAREQTHGARNGWHPHMHTLVATRAPLSEHERVTFEDAFYVQWVSALVRLAGYKRPRLPRRELGASWDAWLAAVKLRFPMRADLPTRERGITFTESHRDDYIQKLGLADELTRGLTKKGHKNNRTPFQIMADYARDRTPRDRAILREYIPAMKGAKQLTWSRGRGGAEDLRRIYAAALAALEPDDGAASLTGFESEEELVNRVALDGVKTATVVGRQWDALTHVLRAARTDAEYELVTFAEAGAGGGALGVETLLARAHAVGAALVARDPDKWGPRLRKWLRWLAPPVAPPAAASSPSTVLDVADVGPARVYRLAARA